MCRVVLYKNSTLVSTLQNKKKQETFSISAWIILQMQLSVSLGFPRENLIGTITNNMIYSRWRFANGEKKNQITLGEAATGIIDKTITKKKS